MINTNFVKEVGPFKWAFRTAIRQFYKRIAKRDHQMRLPTGETITLPITNRFASEAFITNADVDWGSEALLFSLLKGRGAFIDVGAHIGYYSLYVLPKVTAAYCFEPDPRVRGLLEKNLAQQPRAHMFPLAVGAEEGVARFTLEHDAAVSHLSEKDEQGTQQIEVSVVTVDGFVEARGLTVEAIKIDVEGHDCEVVAGALAVLAKQKPIVLTEAKPDATLFELVAKVDYQVLAYVRDLRTRAKAFRAIAPDQADVGDTKMLFLVPSSMVDEVNRQAA